MYKVADLSVNPRYFKWDFIKEDFNVENYIKRKEYVYDADSCGNETNFWVVVKEGTPRFYRSYHEWYWNNYGQEDSELINEFEIEEVTQETLNGDAKINLRFVI